MEGEDRDLRFKQDLKRYSAVRDVVLFFLARGTKRAEDSWSRYEITKNYSLIRNLSIIDYLDSVTPCVVSK